MGVNPNREGRVVDIDGEHLPGVYATGWIKRGPVGLIGHTKSDASETVRHLVEDVTGAGDGGDVAAADLTAGRVAPLGEPEAVLDFLRERGVDPGEGSGWVLVDAYERWRGGPGARPAAPIPRRPSAARRERPPAWRPSASARRSTT